MSIADRLRMSIEKVVELERLAGVSEGVGFSLTDKEKAAIAKARRDLDNVLAGVAHLSEKVNA